MLLITFYDFNVIFIKILLKLINTLKRLLLYFLSVGKSYIAVVGLDHLWLW